LIKFVIFGFPRSGSTYLCSLLNAHPRILCHYEVFHPDAIGTVYGFADKAPEMRGFTPASRDADPQRFIETLFKYPLGADAVGFKIFVGHSAKAHELILNDKSIAKILLDRSTLDAYVSMIIAQQTGQFTGPPQSVKVDIAATGLLTFDDTIQGYFDGIETNLRNSGQRYLKVRYEDIVADEAKLNDIFDFIGVERGSAPLAAFTSRQNSELLEDKVGNLHQVVEDLIVAHRLTKKAD
jgi:LPS sulfotransferase NodH